MSRNEIRLDQIQQRLAGSNRSRQTQYDEYGYAIPEKATHDDFIEQSEEPTTLNAGFIATIVAASLTAGMGTFYFIGGELPGFNFGFGGGSKGEATLAGSVLDPVCGKGWQANLPNTDQMHCYLTRQVYRLCDKDEHVALLATIRQYDKDYKVWYRKYMGATFKTIGKLQTQGMQLGLEAAKLNNMKGGNEAEMDQFNKVTGMASDIMKPANDMLAQRVNKVPEYELEKAAYTLARSGYIEAKDFKTKPDFIARALKRAGKVKTACPNRES